MKRNCIYPIYIFILLQISFVDIFAITLNPRNPKDREYILRNVEIDTLTDRPKISHGKFRSPQGNFLIHYDTSGLNKVNRTDINKNNVPDYVDSVAFYFEKALSYHLQLGMKSPSPDDGGGSSTEYDIYLWDLGNSDEPNTPFYEDGGVYGYTFDYKPEFSGKFPKSYSFIVMDNDYSPTDSIRPLNQPSKNRPAYKETGMTALKITAIHELHHAIQFRYGSSYPSAITIMEMCAMGMEFGLYPDSEDYMQHANKLLQNLSIYPFGIDDQYAGYGFSIFNQYFFNKFKNISITKRLWELVESGIEVYGALDSALKEQKSSLPSAFCEFSEWMYYTGSKAKGDNYLWHADELKDMKFYFEKEYIGNPISTSGKLKPFEIRGIRFMLPGIENYTGDTIDIVFSNLDLNSASAQVSTERDYFVSLSNNQVVGSIKIEGFDDLYLHIASDDLFCHKIYINKGLNTTNINYAFPNPLDLNQESVIYLPAPDGVQINEKCSISIYSAEMNEIYSAKNIKVGLINDKLIIPLDLSIEIKNIGSGVYFYAVNSNNNSNFGKFSIIKK